MQIAPRSKSNHVGWALALDRPKLDEPALRVDSVMSRDVFTCRLSDSLNVAAQIMWDHDFGCVPVLDRSGHLVGMLTDRDICMAAHTLGGNLNEIAVASVCSRDVYACHRDEPLSDAARTMARTQVRRLPVLDADRHLVGIVTVSDLIRHFWFKRSRIAAADSWPRMAALLEAVSRPRVDSVRSLAPMSEDEREYLAMFEVP